MYFKKSYQAVDKLKNRFLQEFGFLLFVTSKQNISKSQLLSSVQKALYLALIDVDV